jgi:hypothetical protein
MRSDLVPRARSRISAGANGRAAFRIGPRAASQRPPKKGARTPAVSHYEGLTLGTVRCRRWCAELEPAGSSVVAKRSVPAEGAG